ncbi:DUF6636 domain-containing protein [Mycobacterium sp. NPDC051804]|uniref:DUF6636 domain-containing protein n=1 Tax=Mycobacterium sp. NPDC051804 TaxID=3364295 RepID=UPI0037A82C93
MAQPGILAVAGSVAGSVAVLALSACTNSPDAASTSASSAETQASAAQSPPDTSTTTAAPQPMDREVFTYTGFISPTGNVSCMIDVDLARCDIIDRDWSPPPRPADCEFDYGHGIQIVPGETASFVCAGDTAFGAEDVLAYGDAITAGLLRCESAEAGITCRDTGTGHGFTLARDAYQVF